MTRIQKYCEHIALSIAIGGGMGIFAVSAAAQSNSCTDVRGAQQQLKTDGYYKGRIDGINGSMTRSAIRQYQKDNSLSVNGRLDSSTCSKLGLTGAGEANRSSSEAPPTQNNSSNSASQKNSSGNSGQGATSSTNSASNAPVMSNQEFKANVESAQRQLKQKGLYSGSINGVMDSKTETAIRKYQQSNGLSVTGQLDQDTLNSLGISQQH